MDACVCACTSPSVVVRVVYTPKRRHTCAPGCALSLPHPLPLSLCLFLARSASAHTRANARTHELTHTNWHAHELARTHARNKHQVTSRQTTTSFLLYMCDTPAGGTTDFLNAVNDGNVLYSVAPRRGSILVCGVWGPRAPCDAQTSVVARGHRPRPVHVPCAARAAMGWTEQRDTVPILLHGCE